MESFIRVPASMFFQFVMIHNPGISGLVKIKPPVSKAVKPGFIRNSTHKRKIPGTRMIRMAKKTYVGR
jgi:hypothetical protein